MFEDLDEGDIEVQTECSDDLLEQKTDEDYVKKPGPLQVRGHTA